MNPDALMYEWLAHSTFSRFNPYPTAPQRRGPRPAGHEAKRKKVKAARKASRKNR